MGFLDSIIKKTAKSLVGDAIDKVAGDIFTPATSTHRESSQSLSLDERIESVCNARFPEYSLSANVPAYTYQGDSDAANISYVLTKDQMPKLGIMVLSGRNDYSSKPVRLAHQACENYGFHCINIMEYLPSTEEYITQRIAENIR